VGKRNTGFVGQERMTVGGREGGQGNVRKKCQGSCVRRRKGSYAVEMAEQGL
jgi:hypothetical protein